MNGMIGYMGRARDIEEAKKGCKEAAERANEKAQYAEETAENANARAEEARTAADGANTAAQVANTAAEQANTKAQTANEAADRANTAAQAANTAAEDVEDRVLALAGIRGMKILWSGLLKGDAATGAAIDFTIQKDCFFDGEKELIIAVNGYCPNEGQKAYELCMVGMCFGSKEDFGITDNNTGAPYNSGGFYRGIYQKEAQSVEEHSDHYLIAKVMVEKVPDSRYAVCRFINSSPCFYVTSISAVVPG